MVAPLGKPSARRAEARHRFVTTETGPLVNDRFELKALAGTGGMGAVFRAHDRLTGATVAVKILHLADAAAIERFQREARALAELRHAGVVAYVAHGTTAAGELYLVMEWLEGEDLATRLTRGSLTVAESLILTDRLAEALAAAHARDIVHRDVKPRNIYLPEGSLERAKLLDFGLARLPTGRSLTRTGAVMGTPAYMAPEQARGASELDARADVFSLGAVLFECLTGRPPFQAENPAAVLAQLQFEDAPRASDLLQGVPPELDALIARALARDPSQRPRDAGALLDELRQLRLRLGADAVEQKRDEHLTSVERRFVTVILAGRPAGLDGVADAETQQLEPSPGYAERLRSIGAPFGAKIERLADGRVAAMLALRSTLPDQAVLAARLAIALRRSGVPGPFAIATGPGIPGVAAAPRPALDRAVGLLANAQPGPAILLDPVTAGLLDRRFDLARCEGVHQLRDEHELEQPRTVLGKPTPCVGRETEQETLRLLFKNSVTESAARAVLVTGPAGMGKSRLRQELVADIERNHESAEVWIGRGDPLAIGSPFGMIVPALRRAAGIRDGEPLSLRRHKLRQRVARVMEGDLLDRTCEFLGELIGVPHLDHNSPELRAAREDRMLRGDRMRRAFEDWLEAECAEHPVVLVLEDLHWGDLPSVKLLDSALRRLRDRPFFVLALARPDVHHLFPELWMERGVQELRLAPLGKMAGVRLVRTVLGPELSDAAAAALVERSEGNAFYLEELIRAQAGGGSGAAPEGVLAIVQSRLQALPADARRVLRAASVFGSCFNPTGVAELLGDERVVSEWLPILDERELVGRRRDHQLCDDDEYVFQHDLVREAAYAMLSDADRALGHRLAGAWLEGAGVQDAMALAGHFERGGAPELALAWYRRAAEQALEGNDFDAALARTGRAAACGASGDALGELQLIESQAHQWRGEFAAAESKGIDALGLLVRESPAWFRAAGEIAMASGRLSHLELLTVQARELELAAPVDGASAACVVALSATAMQLYLLGSRPLADRLVERIERLAVTANLDCGTEAWVLAARYYQAHNEDRCSACKLAVVAAGLFERAGNLRQASFALGDASFIKNELGMHAEAVEHGRKAVALAERMALDNVAASGRQNLAAALTQLGELVEAATLLRDGLVRFAAHGDRRMEGATRVYLAATLARSGDRVAAEVEARAAIALLEQVPPLQPWAQATLAELRLEAGDLVEARQLAAQAKRGLDVQKRLEAGEALVLLMDAETLHATGETAAARTALDTAHRRLLENAAAIAIPEWRHNFLTAIPEHARTIARADDWSDAYRPLPGDVLAGRFEVERAVEFGEQITTCLALDRLTDAIVRLEVLAHQQAEELERFAGAARLHARLHHQTVARYVAHGVMPSGHLYLATERPEGDATARPLPAELTADEALALLGRVASALAAVHAQGAAYLGVDAGALVLLDGAPGRPLLRSCAAAWVASRSSVDPAQDMRQLRKLATRFYGVRGVPEPLARLLERAPKPPTASELAQLCELLGTRAGASAERPRLVSVLVSPCDLADAVRRVTTTASASLTVHRLAGGGCVVVPAAAGAPDQAVVLARAALAMRRHGLGGPLALATGDMLLGETGPSGPALEHAIGLLAGDGASEIIHVDPASAGLLDPRFHVVAVTGAFELRGEREAEQPRSLLGRPTPCVGRDAELVTLRMACRRAITEPAALAVLVTGAAGMGKSRLRQELLANLEHDGKPIEVWMGRGDPLSAGSPFATLASMLRRAVHIDQDEPPEVQRGRLRSALARYFAGEALERTGEFLAELLAVPRADGASALLRAARENRMLMGDQMLRAFGDCLEARLAEHPVALVLEDLHWGDLPSVNFVDAALRRLRDRPLFVLALARPEVHQRFPELWRDRGLQVLRLSPLSSGAGTRLVRAVLGPDLPETAARRLVQHAAGNALYLEELIRAESAGAGESAPVGVRAMMEARLRAQPAHVQRVLCAASVFGPRFRAAGVAAVLDGEAALGDALTLVEDCELAVRRGSPAEDDYSFRHDVVHEAAYAMLGETDCVAAHRRAGEWLEAAGGTDSMALAGHFEQGGLPGRAIVWFRRAAEQALDGNDFDAAIARVRRAAACGAQGEMLGELHLLAAQAHQWRGEFADAERDGRAALALLARGSRAWFRAVGEVALASGRLSREDWVAEQAGELAHIAPAGAAEDACVAAMSCTAMQSFLLGRRDLGDALVERIEGFAATGKPLDEATEAWVLAARYYRAGRASECALAIAAAERFERAGNLRHACFALGDAGYDKIELGLHGEAVELLRKALELAQRMGLDNVASAARQNLGWALLHLGEVESARELLVGSLARFVAHGDRRMEAGLRVYLAAALVRAGDSGAAEHEVRTALATLDAHSPLRPWVLANLCAICLAGAHTEEARMLAAEARRGLDEAGRLETGEALVRLMDAETLQAVGEHAAARAALAECRERLLERAAEIENPKWRESFLTAVPENARTLALVMDEP